jgi:SNF2 family DNA or RNA helicase
MLDEMGLGKSVMILALIAKVKESEHQIASSSKEVSSPVNAAGPTLIVAPLSMLPQWQDEIESKTTMSVYIYYNHCKKGDVDLSRYDIALTTCMF